MLITMIILNIFIILYTKYNFERNIVSKINYDKITLFLFILSYTELLFYCHEYIKNGIFILVFFLTVPYCYNYFQKRYDEETILKEECLKHNNYDYLLNKLKIVLFIIRNKEYKIKSRKNEN